MWHALLVLVVMMSCVPTLVSAHGDGASFETIVGDYLVDIGYEPELPTSGERLVLDFSLREQDAEAPFDRVWVRIEQYGKTVLAGGIGHAPIGPTTLTMTPAREGELKVYARYEQSQKTLAEVSFPIAVAPASENEGVMPWMYDALLAAAAAFGGFVLGRRTVRSVEKDSKVYGKGV